MSLLRTLVNKLTVVEDGQDTSPLCVVQYGATKSNSFRRDVLRDNLTLPALPDQGSFRAVLLAVRQFYLPSLTDEDFDNLKQMLALLDDVILLGLQDPLMWVFPEGFLDIPFVKDNLDKGVPVDRILECLLNASRTYIWLYRDEDVVNELFPLLLELEEAFQSLKSNSPIGSSSNRGRKTNSNAFEGVQTRPV